MRNDERLRTIYEVMAPYIVRNEHNWRDYLAFASQFYKHSFDNILLVYAQDEDVSILATRKQWAAIGRNLIPRAKGVAVCVYRNAKLTLDYLFDVSQTTGKEIHPTDWQLSDEMKKALTERLSYAHGFPKQDFPQALYAMASESVAENYNHFLQELKQETKGHLFTEIPAGGFEAQYIQLLTDSISYFIGKKCHLPDEEIQLSDGMATVSHFNTLPLVAHLGTAVELRPAASVAGLLVTGGPYLLAALLTHGKTLAIGGGDIKLMGACGFVLGVWPGLLHSILSLILAVLTGVMLFGVRRQDFSSIRLPLAPFFCIGGVTAYWLAAAAAVI